MRFVTATRIVFTAATLLAASGVFAQVGPPPAPQYEAVPAARAGYVWDPGHWHWAPARARYVWTPGHWQVERVGFRWMPGHWDGPRWIPGHWVR
ncbi:hypothetical protein [Paraburkholderia heleia]|uniref:hypothetical protein n=1 Tax=Paraburkholderia heleia TaxID=634127 RepID=UPI002AB7281F|nr:hypothetical protein [Paraburkholderia heleia]